MQTRKQRAVISRVMSKWSEIMVGVSQCSILGPVLILIDLPKGHNHVKLTGDQVNLASIVQ